MQEGKIFNKTVLSAEGEFHFPPVNFNLERISVSSLGFVSCTCVGGWGRSVQSFLGTCMLTHDVLQRAMLRLATN
jgi:hypothetical protein